jgi:hypothetical protein
MPLSNSEPTDGNTAQWDKVKAMRDRNAAAAAGEPSGTPITVVGLEKMQPAETPPAEMVEKPAQPRGEDGKFVKALDETVAPPAETLKETPPAAAAPPAEVVKPAAPAVKEVLIDGVKVNLAPELADAFERAEKIKKDQSAEVERERLKDELRAELRKELAPPAKSEAELAAERALAAAEEAKNAPKEPDTKLLIENPEEWQKQNRVHQDYLIAKAAREAKEETLREIRQRDAQAAANADKNARAIVREQFYNAYPVLKDSADIVDIMLTKSMDDLVASGRLQNANALPPAQREAMKHALFADVASQATRRLVKLMNGGKTVAPPAGEAPPTLVTSAPAKQAKPPVEKAAEPKPKYPKGSMSAVLAERKARLAGTAP